MGDAAKWMGKGRMLMLIDPPVSSAACKKVEARKPHAYGALGTKHRHAISTLLHVLDLYFRH